jgi:uncharacterized C2H2 Zn-finger protein
MARARRSPQAATKPADTQTETAGEFTCPECGKTFTRAASLGAHRNRAHGIAGTSKPARTSSRRRSAARTAAASNGRRRRTISPPSRDAVRPALDRDALLQQLFPDGLPARESVIRAANDWLDQAEQLAKMK